MIFLEIHPLSKSVAIAEIVIILVVAALLGYLLSRLLAASKLKSLREEVELKEIELSEYRTTILEVVPEAKPVPSVVQKQAVVETLVVTKTNNPVAESEPTTPDDLKIIEGIGPKIEEILNKSGIDTYSKLSDTTAVKIASILKSAGPRFQIHDPTSWPQQAGLAKHGEWDELEKLKIKLISGRV